MGDQPVLAVDHVALDGQIRGSRLEIFEENEGGNHFMFMENPQKFNRIVRDFMS